MTRSPLLEHQRTGIEWITRDDRPKLLADEPGLGKSCQAIRAFDGGRNLVIAPAMVLDGGTWDDEIAKWSDHPDRWVQASYTRLNKREILKTGGNRPIPGQARDEYAGPWDAIVVDEAHYTKNKSANWTDTIEKLAKNAGAVIEMTGTPISHWAPDLYTTLRVMHPDESRPGGRFGSRWRWLEEWFDIEASRFGGPNSRVIGDLKACNSRCLARPDHDPCKHYRKFMEANLGGQILRRLRDDCLDLPPITIQQVRTPMDADQKRMYGELKRDFSTTTREGESFDAWSNGSKISLMTRVTTSSWLLGKNGEPRGGKFEQLRYDLEQRSRPTLVVGHYQDVVDASARVAMSMGLEARIIKGGTSPADRKSIVRQFQNGDLPVLAGSLEVVAEGLNLTSADMVIFMEKSYKPSRNKQTRDRIHRMGQTRPCTIREYLTPNSLDAARDRMLAVKNDRQMRMLTAADFVSMM